MSPRRAAIAAGASRGLREFLVSLRTPADVGFYVGGIAAFIIVMILVRNTPVEGLGITVAQLLFPGLLGMQLAISATWGLATILSTEREDGTLLRAKSLPNGMLGYVVGQNTRALLDAAFAVGILVIPAIFIIPGLWETGPGGALAALGFLALGLLALTPLGFAIGSIVPNPRAVGGWGLLVLGFIVSISGIFFPIVNLPAALQVIAQLFPVYWLGLGLRSALLPDAAAVIEIGESWRTLETLGVLGLWAVVGLVLAPVLLRRMARRESGSTVSARRDSALQRV